MEFKFYLFSAFLLWSSWANASVNFDGSSQYLEGTSINLGLNGATQMSVEMWVNVICDNASTDEEFVFSKDDTNATQNNSSWGFDNTCGGGTGVEFVWAGSGSTYWDPAFTIPSFGVHHIVFVWNRSAGTYADFTVYVDGTAEGVFDDSHGASGYSVTFTAEEDSNNFFVGEWSKSALGYYEGNISELAIWNKALTAAEAATLYNDGIQVPCKRIPLSVESGNLLFYVPLDDKTTGAVATTPTQLGSATASLTEHNNPTWSSQLECQNALTVTGGLTARGGLTIQ